jgi:hypothetical protein
MVENGFRKYQEAKNFLATNLLFCHEQNTHQTESKSCDGKCVNCLHVLFKFGPKSRFFIRHDVLKSDPTVPPWDYIIVIYVIRRR